MNLIVAVTNDYAIGKGNDLLFHLPTDLAFFKEKTINKVVIMGEKTYFSLPKRPLPKRTTIVLSDNPNFQDENVIIVRNVKELFEEVRDEIRRIHDYDLCEIASYDIDDGSEEYINWLKYETK